MLNFKTPLVSLEPVDFRRSGYEILSAKAASKSAAKTPVSDIPDLSDPKIDEQMSEKYEAFQQPQPLYRDLRSCVSILGGIFSAAEFRKLGTQLMGDSDQMSYPEMMNKTENTIASHTNDTFRIGRNYVEVGVSLPQLTFTIYPANGDKEKEKALDTVTKIIRTYFNNFKIPTKWKLVIDEKSKTPSRQPDMVETTLNAQFTLEELTRLKPPYTPDTRADRGPSLYPEITKDYTPFAGVGQLQMQLEPVSVRSSGYEGMDDVMSTGKAGDINGSDYGIVYKIVCTGIFRYPLEYALWSTSTYSLNEFNPITFWNLISSRHVYFNTPQKSSRSAAVEPPDYVADLGSTYRDYLSLTDQGKKTPKSKASDDDFIIDGDGNILWVPNIDRVGEYTQQLRGAYDAQTGKIMPAGRIPGIANQPVFAEWETDKFLFTNNIGRLEAVDLTGCRPLDKVTILRFMGENITDEVGVMLARHVHEGALKFNLYTLPAYKKMLETAPLANRNMTMTRMVSSIGGHEAMEKDATKMMQVAMACPLPLSWRDLGTQDFGASDEFPMEKKAAFLFTWLVREQMRYFDKLDIEFRDKMFTVRLLYLVLAKYCQPAEIKDLQENMLEAVRRNSSKPEINYDPRKAIKLYNLPGLKGLLPHQVKVYRDLETDPDGALIDVDPGGGKTTLGIIDVARLLGIGKIHKPLVVCPGNLVRDWVTEINRWSLGRLNAFPITLKVWRRWRENVGFNEDQISDLINRQPKNTIFITDYNFLSKDSGKVSYESYEFDYLPMAIWISKQGFDYFWADESHRLKNTESTRTKAANIISARCNFRRLASGTIIFNVASDMTGQVGQINPRVLGDKAAFNATYTKDGKGQSLIPGGGDKLAQAIKPYARKTTVKRKEWAYLLPPIEESFHPAQMTPNQAKFYDQTLTKILEDIKKDKKIQDLLKSGDAAAQEKLEELLKPYFTKLEVFVNAPDSTYDENTLGNVFKNLSTTKAEDLLSPKIKVIDEICKIHFEGGYVTKRNRQGVETQVLEKPDPNKILIFGFNKPISVHIIQHMRYKNIAIQFAAGDMDALDQAKTDPKIRILVADENSIKEGHNMQMFSRIIRLQSLWTPGEQDQALARMLRPDVPDENGRTKYDRSQGLNFDWIVTNNSLEVAKTARLISKIIQKAKMDYDKDTSFLNMYQANEAAFENVESISMNLDFIKDYSNFKALGASFDGYSILKTWEDAEFKTAKDKLKAQLEKIYGRPILDGEVASLASQKVDGSLVIPGSNLDTPSYVPFVEGAVPVDLMGLNLKPLAELGDDDDDNSNDKDLDAEQEDPVSEGMLVWTEFGPGYVAKVRKNASVLRVVVPGFSERAIQMNRKIVFRPTNPKATAQLADLMKRAGKSGLPKLRPPKGGLEITKTQLDVDLKTLQQQSTEIEQDMAKGVNPADKAKTKVMGKPWLVDFHALLVSGQLAMTVEVDKSSEKYAPRLINRGWKDIGNVIGAEIKTYQAMDRLVDLLVDKYVVPPNNQAELRKFALIMKTKKAQEKRITRKDITFIRDFFRDAIKKPKDRLELSPHVALLDGKVVVLFNTNVHPIARRLLSMKRQKNMGAFEDFGHLLIKFFGTKDELNKEIQHVADLNILPVDPKELKSMIEDI